MKSLAVTACVALVMILSAPVYAVIVTSAGATQGVIFITDDAEVTWESEIIADPNADPIMKVINTNGAAGIVALIELLHVGEGPSLADWHEQLMIPDDTGGWIESPSDDKLLWSSVSVVDPVLPITISTTSDLATIVWGDARPPGSFIHIEKLIEVPEGMDTFAIMEWPTVIPEPSIISLLGFGLLAFLRPKRRRN